MTELTHRIQGIALVENLAAANAIAAQLPNADHGALFSTGIALGKDGAEAVARLVDVAARAPAIAAAQAMMAGGIPAAFEAARIIPRDEEEGTAAWLAGLGFTLQPTQMDA